MSFEIRSLKAPPSCSLWHVPWNMNLENPSLMLTRTCNMKYEPWKPLTRTHSDMYHEIPWKPLPHAHSDICHKDRTCIANPSITLTLTCAMKNYPCKSFLRAHSDMNQETNLANPSLERWVRFVTEAMHCFVQERRHLLHSLKQVLSSYFSPL